MKKVLLGLLALSATLTASSLENGDTSIIQVDTKAYVIDSGLIITNTDSTTDKTPITNVELDHGRILATAKATSTASNYIYVKKSNGSNFPTGTQLNIGLTASNDNNLTNGDSIIAHTLTATTDATGTDISLSGSGDNSKNVSGNFTVGENKSSVKVTLISFIAPGALDRANGDFADGEYNNTSTLTVKISRIPSSNSNTGTR